MNQIIGSSVVLIFSIREQQIKPTQTKRLTITKQCVNITFIWQSARELPKTGKYSRQKRRDIWNFIDPCATVCINSNAYSNGLFCLLNNYRCNHIAKSSKVHEVLYFSLCNYNKVTASFMYPSRNIVMSPFTHCHVVIAYDFLLCIW